MAKLIIVDAPHRILRELYGAPPFIPHPDGEAGGTTPICTPKRGEQTVDEWYAEQEARHGLYAALKAKRPKRSWWGGQKEEPAEQAEPEVPAYRQRQLPDRQPQRLSVQQRLRQQRQIADRSGVSETRTADGIYWFAIESEEVDT